MEEEIHMRIFTCATCGKPIVDPRQGNLISTDVQDSTGKTIAIRDWRIVHKGVCDPHKGPWHSLNLFTRKNGAAFFRRMEKEGAFKGISQTDLDALRQLLLA